MSRTSSRLLFTPLAAALVGVGAIGCQTSPKPAPMPPPVPLTAEQLEQIRADFQQTDPGVKVGQVTDVLQQGQGESLRFSCPGATFRAGSVVTIIDNHQDPIANGTIFTTSDGTADVNFTRISGKRRPAVGDAVVQFSTPPAADGRSAPASTQP